jgi:hypothetical protein
MSCFAPAYRSDLFCQRLLDSRVINHWTQVASVTVHFILREETMNKLLSPVIAAIFAFVSVGAFAADDSKADKMERQATPTARAKQNIDKAEDKVESKAKTTKAKVKSKTKKAKKKATAKMDKMEDKMEKK